MFIRPVNLGAEPASAMDCRMRPVEYSPEFRLESAAVSATRFITPAAPGMPSLSMTVTNGLWSPEYEVYGSRRARSTTEPT